MDCRNCFINFLEEVEESLHDIVVSIVESKNYGEPLPSIINIKNKIASSIKEAKEAIKQDEINAAEYEKRIFEIADRLSHLFSPKSKRIRLIKSKQKITQKAETL